MPLGGLAGTSDSEARHRKLEQTTAVQLACGHYLLFFLWYRACCCLLASLCRALMRDRRAAAWRLLTAVEKDALIVLTAMCKASMT